EGKHNKVLVDARSHPRYLGEMEPLDPIAGHIPTARNFDWEQLKEGNQIVLNEEITKVVSKDENVIVYCGSGVSATPLFAVLDELGYENIQLYTGSYSDWVAHYEIATGEE
ncbi:MAG: rhodanese-like domain-containing protein, partial [Kurthia sp.]